MGLRVEQDCPQCGAPIALDETDNILECPYCDVRLFIHAPSYFRYLLPHKAPGESIIYAPYLRFNGNVYFCRGYQVSHRVVDITNVGLAFKGLPATLGLRPQAMKLRSATSDTDGTFLKFTLKASDILARAASLTSDSSKSPILHRAYIGETLSLIYLPLYVKGERLFDAVLNRAIARVPGGREVLDRMAVSNARWDLRFIPMLCPRCGWSMEGHKDSVILTCSNCQTAWESSKGRFVEVRVAVAPGEGENTLYLPFWKITAGVEGVTINSFADFIRLTNQPRVIGKEWEKEAMHFWAPGFKIRPRIFLKLGKQFTVSQRRFEEGETMQGKSLYPVTLPRAEAAQAMKVILAASAVNKKNVMPYLPRIRFEVTDASLVYLPFTQRGHELVQQHMNISINRNSLEYGRRR